jgi:DNA sulfur modification protein DndD
VYLEKIVMTDFMPYIGTQEVDFSVSPDAPIILIEGENNRGKSSLFTAIRWCLYGRALDRSSKEVQDQFLLNDNAFDIGRDNFEVQLSFKNNNDNYLLTRSCTVKRDSKGKRNGSSVRTFLHRNRDAISTEDIPRYINEVLDESISMFFLADMEILKNYETLVEDDSKAAVEVKSAIEDILGIPSLISVRDALKEIVDDTYKEIQKKKKENSEKSELEQKIAEQTSKKSNAKTQYDIASASMAEKKREQDELTSKLAKIADASELIEREKTLIEKNENDLKSIDKLRKEIQVALHESWWAPVSTQVELKVNQTQDQTKLASQRHQSLSEKKFKLNSLENSLVTNKCSECQQDLPVPSRDETKKTIEVLQAEIQEMSKPLIPSLESLVDESRRLSLFSMPRKAEVIRSLERQIRILQNDAPKRRQEIKDISLALQGVNKDEVKNLELQRQNKDREIGAVAMLIRSESTKLANAEKELTVLNRKFLDAPKSAGDMEISTEMAIASSLQEIMEDTVSRFRLEMKKTVEKNATEIFAALGSENVFKQLQINDNYGLRLVDNKGQVFDHKSAGTAQVIAISLILALAKSAARSNALVLDTPFARLDDTHRDNVLKLLSRDSKQSILLIQSGEKISKDIEPEFRKHVSRTYKISIGADPKESTISLKKQV